MLIFGTGALHPRRSPATFFLTKYKVAFETPMRDIKRWLAIVGVAVDGRHVRVHIDFSQSKVHAAIIPLASSRVMDSPSTVRKLLSRVKTQKDREKEIVLRES